jgi:hypothetical protein
MTTGRTPEIGHETKSYRGGCLVWQRMKGPPSLGGVQVAIQDLDLITLLCAAFASGCLDRHAARLEPIPLTHRRQDCSQRRIPLYCLAHLLFHMDAIRKGIYSLSEDLIRLSTDSGTSAFHHSSMREGLLTYTTQIGTTWLKEELRREKYQTTLTLSSSLIRLAPSIHFKSGSEDTHLHAAFPVSTSRAKGQGQHNSGRQAPGRVGRATSIEGASLRERLRCVHRVAQGTRGSIQLGVGMSTYNHRRSPGKEEAYEYRGATDRPQPPIK